MPSLTGLNETHTVAVLGAVSRMTGIGSHFIKGRRRFPNIVHARVVAAIVFRERYRASWRQLGELFERDHNSLRRLTYAHRHDPRVVEDVQKCGKSLDAQFSAPAEGGRGD